MKILILLTYSVKVQHKIKHKWIVKSKNEIKNKNKKLCATGKYKIMVISLSHLQCMQDSISWSKISQKKSSDASAIPVPRPGLHQAYSGANLTQGPRRCNWTNGCKVLEVFPIAWYTISPQEFKKIPQYDFTLVTSSVLNCVCIRLKISDSTNP